MTRAGSTRTELSLYKLQVLLNFTSLLGQEDAPRLLVERFKQVIEKDLGIDKILFYIREETGWELLLNSRFTDEVVSSIDVDADFGDYKTLSIMPHVGHRFPAGVDVVIPIVQNDEAKAYVLLGESSEDAAGVSPIIRHLPFAQTLSSISFVALENFKLVAQAIREEELRSQFRLAARLQGMLIPKSEDLPALPGVQVASSYHPYYAVGGDYFDVVAFGKEKIAFCMADVSGKGVASALLMTNFQANFRAHIDADRPLDGLVYLLNKLVIRMAENDLFVTFFVGRYDSQRGSLEYVNAGQSPPFLYDYTTGELQELGTTTTGLGMIERMPDAQVRSIDILHRCMLYCYTDGIVEYRRNGREVYCTELLTSLMPRCQSASGLVDAVLDRVDAEVRQGDRQVFDDMSQLALRFDPLEVSA